jgi:hypothetical protein
VPLDLLAEDSQPTVHSTRLPATYNGRRYCIKATNLPCAGEVQPTDPRSNHPMDQGCDGRAVSGYLQGNAIRRDSEGYWLTNSGREWLRGLSVKLGVDLPEVRVDDPDEDSDT